MTGNPELIRRPSDQYRQTRFTTLVLGQRSLAMGFAVPCQLLRSSVENPSNHFRISQFNHYWWEGNSQQEIRDCPL